MGRETKPAVGSVPAGPLRPLSEDDIAAGVMPRLQHVVETRPDHLAVADGTERVTFAELAARAAEVRLRLDGLLSAPHVPADAPVALLAGHDVATVVSAVGVLATGRPVVMLDRRTPLTWQHRLLAPTGAAVVIADGSAPDASRAVADLAAGGRSPLLTGQDTADPAALWRDPPAAEAPALVAFTSGTTGATKPVVGSHRLLVRDAWNSAVGTCCYDAHDVVVNTLPLPFHAGCTTALHTLLIGCGVHLVDVRDLGVSPLPQILADTEATLLVTSPAILRGLTASRPDSTLLTGLTGLTVAGETVYGQAMTAAREVLGPQCVIRNRYGASEVGLIAEHVVTDTHDGRVPVGRGVGWSRVDVVREDGSPADVGEKGTITITAPDLALGYMGRPDDPAFVDNGDGTRTFRSSDLGVRLPDGSIDLTGRSDHAVAVRGYLVDPGEVEAVALTLPGVRECLVVGQETENGVRLVAYVVGEAASDAAAIRTRLRERLPGHMVPAEVVAMSTLPRTDRGKIDRTALPTYVPARSGHEPLGQWEQLVADAWTAVLGVEDITADDDFFALGGDSLAAEELMTRMRDDLGIAPARATSATLAQAPTLRAFAGTVRPTTRLGRAGLVTLHASGSRPPVFVVAAAGRLARTLGPLARRLGDDQPVHALQSPGLEGRGVPDTSITALARHHLTSIRGITAGPLLLAGHGFGGLVALEIARLAEESGQDVPLVVLLDTAPPAPGTVDARPRWRRAKSGLGLLRASLADSSGAGESWRWQLQAEAMTARHVVAPRPGAVLVVTASDGPDPDAQDAWDAVLPAAVHRRVPAGPHTMLRPPAVDALAAHIRTAVDDAMAAGGRGRHRA